MTYSINNLFSAIGKIGKKVEQSGFGKRPLEDLEKLANKLTLDDIRTLNAKCDSDVICFNDFLDAKGRIDLEEFTQRMCTKKSKESFRFSEELDNLVNAFISYTRNVDNDRFYFNKSKLNDILRDRDYKINLGDDLSQKINALPLASVGIVRCDLSTFDEIIGAVTRQVMTSFIRNDWVPAKLREFVDFIDNTRVSHNSNRAAVTQ